MSSVNKTSSYRGVSKMSNGKWKSSGTLNGYTYYLGSFSTELEAAQFSAAWRRTHDAQYDNDDVELSTAFPDPIPLRPRESKFKSRVKENINTYSVFIYDKGMGSKSNLYIAALPKSLYSLQDAVNLQHECQEAWDSKDFDYVNHIRTEYGTF